MKVDISDRALEDLEEAEYQEDSQYESYDGDQPPVGTELAGFIKKIWWTYSSNDDDMLKILFIADGNEGEEEEFNGCPIWENYSLIPTMKFKWAPFLDALGLSIRDVIKKTFVEGEEENNGQPIQKIGTWVPGSDESYCRIITGRHKYGEDWQIDVKVWLPYEDAEPEPEPEPARPSRARGGRPTAAGQKATGRTRRKAEAENPGDQDAGDVEDEDIDPDMAEDLEEETKAEKPTRRAGTRRTAAATSRGPGGARAAKPAARGRGRGRHDPADDISEEEVPF
jgi:hypothetical protein